MTLQQAVSWCNSQVGKALDFDGAYGAQCFDLFNFYYQAVTGRNPYSDGYGVAGAKDIYDVPTSLFTKVANNPNDPSQIPPQGAVLIYDGGLPGSGGFGHVAIVDQADAQGVMVWDQNWGGQFVHHQRHMWTGHERGWLVFNGFNSSQRDAMTPAQEKQAYEIVLGREPEGPASGRTAMSFILDAQGEINAQRQAQAAQLAALQGQISEMQKQVDAVKADCAAQIADLTKKLEIAQAGNGDATRWQTLRTLIRALIS
jgi:hypothetical protein